MNELWEILENDKNLHKWQQVVPQQFYATVLLQKRSSKNRNHIEENKNNGDRSQIDRNRSRGALKEKCSENTT